MEDPIKQHQSSVPANSGKSNSKLRYPLRSATKLKDEKPLKEEKPPVAQSSAPRRGRTASAVSQSVGVLDLSANEKPVKPPRRLSIPVKTSSTPVAKRAGGNITPISEARGRGSANVQGKSQTPASDISRASSRKRFSVLSSASYWLSQIKLSESAAKHSISLGFFKLALEAGCEPLQLMRDELKSYARRHNLTELAQPMKELLESFNITENLEQLQISETCSQVPEGGTHSSDDDVISSTSTVGTRKLKPKSLNTDAAQSAKKETTEKNDPPSRSRRTLNKTSDNSKSVSDAGRRNLQKKPQKQTKKDSVKDQKIKRGKKSAGEEGPVSPQATENTTIEENKENMDAAPPTEETSLTEVM